MNWNETVAHNCRYGNVATRIFGELEIIWEHSEDDYQGFANVLAFNKQDNTFIHYDWTYGSCSGCDEWKDRELTEDQIEQEMRSNLLVLHGISQAKKYLKLDEDFIKGLKMPTANSITNGSIPGMLHMGFGGFAEDFEAMRKAFDDWRQQRKEE